MKKEAVKKKKITSKPNTKKKKVAKKGGATWQEEYFNYGFMRLKPANEAYLERLGEEFVEWCMATRNRDFQSQERRFSYERWIEEKGIPLNTMDRWRKRCPFLEQSIKHGMMIIGVRLEEGALTKELSDRVALMSLHLYLERYLKTNRYHADLKNSNDTTAKNTPFTVLMKKI